MDEPDEARGRPVEPFFFLTHGAGGNHASPGLKALGSALAGKGHLVVRADLPYRAAGRKAPPAAELSVSGFTAAFLDARRRFGAGERWVVGGRSYGGRVASMAVAGGLEAAGLLLCAYPLHPGGRRLRLRTGHWPGIAVPCLFLQGSRDPFCDLELLKQHLGRLGAGPEASRGATLLVVEGAGHALRVPAARAPDSRARSDAEVIGSLVDDIEAWIADAVK